MEPGVTAPAATEPASPPATPDAPAADTAQATPPAPQPNEDPLEVRNRNQQAEITRQQQARARAEDEASELREQLAARDAGDGADGGEPGEAKPPRQSRTNAEAAEWQAKYEQEAWARAEALHGPAVLTAYNGFAEMWDRAESPADHLNALEAYVQARIAGAPAPAAGGTPLPTREQAVQPRVDPNRSDAPPVDPIDPAKFAGGANGGVSGWLKARLAAGGPQG